MGNESNVLKKATNVSIRSDLLAEVRELKINISQEIEKHLSDVVRKLRAEQWLKENREAIAAYNRHIERDGLWNDEFRTF